MKPTDTSPQADAWDKAAQGWNSHAALIRTWLKDVTVEMLDAARITLGSHVLDLAAGAGDQTLDIARRVGPGGRVLATDISPRIICLARENALAAGLENIETSVADAQATGLRDANFDAVVCRLGLMFCTVPLDALTGAYAALKPGGRLSALVFSQPQNNPCLVAMMSTACRHAGLSPRLPFQPGTLMSLGQPGLLESLLHTAGFVEIEVRALSAPFSLPSSQHYIDFVRTSGSPLMELLAPLPHSDQMNAWSDMEKQLQVFNTPVGWEGPNELLLCAATRSK